MDVKDWAQQNTGIVLKIPKGTITGHDWWYHLDDGTWSKTTPPGAWRSGMEKQWRPRVTDKDQFVELTIDAGGLQEMAHKATKNRSGKSVDGPLSVKRRR